MRKFQDLAAPDDPQSWYDVVNFEPTSRGTYQLGWGSTGSTFTASGATAVVYACKLKTLSSAREYVVNNKIWENVAGTLTDRTGGVSIGALPMAVNFGDVTIMAMGNSVVTVASSGGNFAALAGAPKANIVLVHANAVLVFNTDTSADGWAASDVGDHTNWTTGEAASGRIYDCPGPIVAACSFGDHVYVFKETGIFRMSYVGGEVKWQIQLAWKNDGIYHNSGYGKHQAVSTRRGIVFVSNAGVLTTQEGVKVKLFDGGSEPVQLNVLTTVLGGTNVVMRYCPPEDTLIVCPGFGSNASGYYNSSNTLFAFYYYYSFASDMWSRCTGGSSEIVASGTNDNFGIVQGDFFGLTSSGVVQAKPGFWSYRGTADTLSYSAPSRPTFCYVTSSKYGRGDGKTTWSRLVPLLRRRTDLGSDAISCVFDLYNEREDTTPATTRTGLSESSYRKGIDLLGGAACNYYARLSVTWFALDVELDDFLVTSSFVPD